MSNHSCDVIVVTCIDFRFQQYINEWIKQQFMIGDHDRVALAGGVKDCELVLNQIRISKKLHNIRRVVLINHEDCGAYGEEGTLEKHAQDLKATSEKIKTEIPDINVEAYYLKLDGTVEKV